MITEQKEEYVEKILPINGDNKNTLRPSIIVKQETEVQREQEVQKEVEFKEKIYKETGNKTQVTLVNGYAFDVGSGYKFDKSGWTW